jgi:hypothetical protein
MSGEDCIAECIVGDKKMDGQRYFLVKWRGRPLAESTYESEISLSKVQNLIDEYLGPPAPKRTTHSHGASSSIQSIISVDVDPVEFQVMLSNGKTAVRSLSEIMESAPGVYLTFLEELCTRGGKMRPPKRYKAFRGSVE